MSALEGSMEREKINRCSGDPLQAASPSVATVFVFDPSRARAAWIGSRISQCGVSCQVVESVSDPRLVSCRPPVAVALEANTGSLPQCLAICEKLFVEIALRRSRGNQSQAARMLGVTSRSIYNMLRKHRLHAQR